MNFVLGLALKYVLPVIISYLIQWGHDEAAKLLGSVTPAQIIKSVKTLPQYPVDGDKNDPFGENAPPPPVTTNMTTGDGTPVT